MTIVIIQLALLEYKMQCFLAHSQSCESVCHSNQFLDIFIIPKRKPVPVSSPSPGSLLFTLNILNLELSFQAYIINSPF